MRTAWRCRHDAWIQSLQIRRRRRGRLAQHGHRLFAVEFLRRSWACRRDPRGPTWQARSKSGMNILQTGTSGLTVVWAEENTRESIFAAMQRKEVYAHQWRAHPGAVVRRLGLRQRTSVAEMIGSRSPMPAACRWAATFLQLTDKVPSFVVSAVKDPADGNLDRIQIIKGWTKQGQIFEKIFDVAWSGDRQVDPVDRQIASGRQHGRYHQGHLYQRHWRGGTEGGLDRP